MIQSQFQRMIGSKAEGFSGGQFGLGVESFNHAAGELTFGAEPVEQQRAVTPQHSSDLLHRFELRAHRTGAPVIEELPGPIRRAIAPEKLKVLLEQVAAHGAQIVAQQIGESTLALHKFPLFGDLTQLSKRPGNATVPPGPLDWLT